MALFLFERKISPPKQAAAVLAGALLLMFGGWALDKIGLFPVEELYAWSIATAFTLLFAIFNSILSLNADNSMRYWAGSMYSYLALAFANGLAAWAFSGIRLSDAGSYRWIYIVITVGFLVFMSMVNFMKKIVEYAEREEWNQPRQRRRK